MSPLIHALAYTVLDSLSVLGSRGEEGGGKEGVRTGGVTSWDLRRNGGRSEKMLEGSRKRANVGSKLRPGGR